MAFAVERFLALLTSGKTWTLTPYVYLTMLSWWPNVPLPSFFVLHTDCSLCVVRSIWVIISLQISFYGEIRGSHIFMTFAACKKGRGAVRREKLLWGCRKVKLWNLTFVNVLSPSLDLSQSFSLGRSYPNLSGLGSPFSDPMKSGAPGERKLAIIEQMIPAAG